MENHTNNEIEDDEDWERACSLIMSDQTYIDTTAYVDDLSRSQIGPVQRVMNRYYMVANILVPFITVLNAEYKVPMDASHDSIYAIGKFLQDRFPLRQIQNTIFEIQNCLYESQSIIFLLGNPEITQEPGKIDKTFVLECIKVLLKILLININDTLKLARVIQFNRYFKSKISAYNTEATQRNAEIEAAAIASAELNDPPVAIDPPVVLELPAVLEPPVVLVPSIKDDSIEGIRARAEKHIQKRRREIIEERRQKLMDEKRQKAMERQETRIRSWKAQRYIDEMKQEERQKEEEKKIKAQSIADAMVTQDLQ